VHTTLPFALYLRGFSIEKESTIGHILSDGTFFNDYPGEKRNSDSLKWLPSGLAVFSFYNNMNLIPSSDVRYIYIHENYWPFFEDVAKNAPLIIYRSDCCPGKELKKELEWISKYLPDKL